MPVLLALLCGAADFAAEMLVLRSGRFGLGASTHATTLLLALALAGFGTGAAISRASHKAHLRLFILYRIAAGVIAALAIALPLLLCAGGGFLTSFAAPAASIAGAFLFAVPAGASVPLLFTWTRGSSFRASILIASGALGSVGGAWFGGITGPMETGAYTCAAALAGANLLIATLSMLSGASFAGGSAEAGGVGAGSQASDTHPDPPHPLEESAPPTRFPRAATAFAFSAGASTLAFESILSRVLPYYLGDTTDAWVWLLGGALLGISAGSLVAGLALIRMRAALTGIIAATALAMSGPALLLVLEFFARTPWMSEPADFGEYLKARFLFIGIFIIPPLFLAGTLSPIAFAMGSGGGRERAARLNLAYAIGAMVPSLLLPVCFSLGATTTTLIGACGLLALPAGIACYGLRALPLILPVLSGMLLGAGDLPSRVPPFRTKPWLEVLEAREGSVGLAASVLDRRLHEKTLFTNNFRAAATGDGYRYTRSLTHLSVLLAPVEPRKISIIAVGTGSTAAAAARYKSIDQIELVDIAGEVFDLLHWFRPASDALFVKQSGVTVGSGVPDSREFDPRVKIVIEDGRRFAARTGEPRDLIILEPLLPDTPAAYPFYTKEFYQLASGRLTKGGVLTQWIPILATEPRAFRSLVGTFTSVFPHRALFLVGKSAILLGSDQPLQLSLGRLSAGLADPELAADLRRTGCSSAGDIAAQCVLGTVGLDAFVTNAPLSDARSSIERTGFQSGARRILYESENLDQLLRVRDSAPAELLPSMEALTAGEQAARRDACSAYLKGRRATAAAARVSDTADVDFVALTRVSAHPFAAMDAVAFTTARSFDLGLSHLVTNEIAKAIPLLETVARRNRDPLGIMSYAICLLRAGRDAEAVLEAAVALALDPNAGRVLPRTFPPAEIPRYQADRAKLEIAAAPFITQIPSLTPGLTAIGGALQSTDPVRRVAARVLTIRERDALAFLVELCSSSALTRPHAELAAALVVAKELYDPTLSAAMQQIEAAGR